MNGHFALQHLHRWGAVLALGLAGAWPAWSLAQTDLPEGVADLQRQWEIVQYKTPEPDRPAQFQTLADRAHAYTALHDHDAAAHTWEGIILSSYAGAKGGLGALGLAKQAKAQFEKAIDLDAQALHGSALSSLGVLYYKVPGWPVGFGDDKKAQALLQRGLALNPDGIDPNYFYADYLVQAKHAEQALPYLDKALAAAPRPGREIADQGRREEALRLKQHVTAELAGH